MVFDSVKKQFNDALEFSFWVRNSENSTCQISAASNLEMNAKNANE